MKLCLVGACGSVPTTKLHNVGEVVKNTKESNPN
jgi:hypothetical protein